MPHFVANANSFTSVEQRADVNSVEDAATGEHPMAAPALALDQRTDAQRGEDGVGSAHLGALRLVPVLVRGAVEPLPYMGAADAAALNVKSRHLGERLVYGQPV